MGLNQELSDLFQSLASLMELRGENTFKVIAFQKVSRIIGESNIDFRKCMEEGKLCDIEGIGKGSQQIIEEYINSGKSTVLEEVSAEVPKGLVALMAIEGLGPKTISLLWKERGITGLELLEKAIADGTLAGLKGIGAKKIDTIKAGIESYKARAAGGPVARRVGIVEALIPAEELLAGVRKIPGVVRAEIAGSLRRRRETIGDVDIVAAAKDMSAGESIGSQFAKLPGVVQIIVAGPSKTSVKIANGMQVDLRLVPEENFGAALLYFTGSKEHNVKIRSLALKKKMTLSEWGLYKLDEYDKAKKEVAQPPPIKPVAGKSEEEIYKKLGLDYVEPEIREDRGEVDAAIEHRLPVLITRADIRGDLHTHTTESDGTASIEEMAAAAKALGYEYLAVTDHSKAMAMARGLTVERLLKHIENIHRIGAKLKGITLLAGSEVDILADGRMDYDDDVLKELDIVVASPHVSLKQDTKKSTDRLLRAIDNKYVNIIGHPTGRLLNRREGLPLDMPRIIAAAAASGTALEINAGYPRLDLDDTNARHASEAGVMITIDTDAHATAEFEQMPYGINVARRAWLTPDKVLNCQPLGAIRKFIKAKRDR
jgi:DNA polymerase (family 10)